MKTVNLFLIFYSGFYFSKYFTNCLKTKTPKGVLYTHLKTYALHTSHRHINRTHILPDKSHTAHGRVMESRLLLPGSGGGRGAPKEQAASQRNTARAGCWVVQSQQPGTTGPPTWEGARPDRERGEQPGKAAATFHRQVLRKQGDLTFPPGTSQALR